MESENFIILAANAGLFCKTQSQIIQPNQSNFQVVLGGYERRDYCVRHARIDDLNDLIELEKLCWKPSIQSSRDDLLRRLTNYPDGQFVLVFEKKNIGVIYSQRISNSEALYHTNSENVSSLHINEGEIVQLLAINIHPLYQERQFGDQLLEFMLQRCAMMQGIKKVVAVSRCRDYHKQKDINLSNYIHLGTHKDQVYDPILLFHYLHGANIIDLIPGYRPKDIENEGCGVLVQYDIHNRLRRDVTIKKEVESQSGVEKHEIMNEQLLDKTALKETISKYLENVINDLLGKSKANKLPENFTLIEMGLDSADFLKLSDQLTVKFNKKLTTTFFFQYNTIAKIISFLVDDKSVRKEITFQSMDKWQEKETIDIAIIGMACRLPGKNNTPEALWNFLKDGKSAINFLPKDRWQWPEDIDLKSEYVGIDRGGFLEDIQYFDADFFRISPEEAKLMDPRQRILLELSWEVFDNCGYVSSALSSNKTGVFIGASGSDYRLCLEKSQKNMHAYLATGNSMAMLSNRLSYFYNLRGPSIVIDTACSSSLVALHQAIRSLRLKECDQALVGGVNIICNLYDTLSYYDAGLLSKAGKCKVFDDDADGYVRSEGAAILMLKPLKQAMSDNDVIHAVIKGSASTHGGKSSGLTVPNPEEQTKLLQEAWLDANIDPSTISYIEAHGTGTKLGDAIELFGIKNAFLEKSIHPRGCGIGSIKSNFGHMEAAGGIVGLLKVVLSLKHHFLPSSINFNKINSQIDLKNSSFYIVQNNQAWEGSSFDSTTNSPKRAGISSFGSGGTNAHIILEEYTMGLGANVSREASLYKPEKTRELFQKKYYWYNEFSNDKAAPVNVYSSLDQNLNFDHAKAPGLNSNIYPLAIDQPLEVSHDSNSNHDSSWSMSLEEKICLFLQRLISEQLGLLPKEVDSRSGFFEMGLTSHQILKLSYEMQQKISENFFPNLFFIHKNIANLAKYILSHYSGKSDFYSKINNELISQVRGNDKIIPEIADRYKPFPLNDIQESFLGGRKMDSNIKVGSHIYLEFDVKGFEIYRLNMAWKRLLDYHEMLRAMILPNGLQQILETLPVYQIKVNDIRTKSESEQIDSLNAIRERLSHRVYGTNEWPLFDICISISSQKQTMHFSIDEMIVDAFSLRLILDQWLQLYMEPKIELPKLNVSFRDYVFAIKNLENSDHYNSDLKYWIKKLDQLPSGPQIPLKSESDKSGKTDFRRTRLNGFLAKDAWQKLRAKLSQYNITPTVFVLTLFAEVLQEWSQEKNFSLILTFFNRLIHPELELICGPFISTSLFIAKPNENSSFIQLIKNNQKELFEDLAHMSVSGIRVLRELKNKKLIPYTFSLPVVFTSLLGFEKFETKAGFVDKINFSVTQTPQVFLDHQVYEHHGELRLSWDVAEEYFSTGILKKMFQDYCNILEKIGSNPDKFLQDNWRFKSKIKNEFFSKKDEETIEKSFSLEVFPNKRMQPFPLTDQQQAYAFGQSDYGAKLTSKIYMCFEAKRLDFARLESAWEKVINDHPMLRTIIKSNGTQQVLQTAPPYTIKVHDLRGKNDNATQQEIDSLENSIISRNKALDHWPYFDLQVIFMNEMNAQIHLSIELMIADSPSIELLQQHLFYYYQNPNGVLPKNTITFSDYVFSQQQYEKTENYQKSLQYWRHKFSDIPPGPDIPMLKNSKITKTYRLQGVLENWNALKLMAMKMEVSPSIILLTAYAEVLLAWSMSDSFSIVIPGWERLLIHSEIDQIVGDFTSMSWLVVSRQKKTLEEKIFHNQEQVKNDFLHKDVSGLKVLRRVNTKERKLNFPFVFTDIHDSSGLIYPTDIKLKKSLSQTPQVYLDNLSYENEGKLNLYWDIGKDIFPDGMIEEMFSGYQKLLNYLIADPQLLKATENYQMEIREKGNEC